MVHINIWLALKDLMKQIYLTKGFCSTLNDKHSSYKDYELALKIYNQFEMKNMVEYHLK